MIEKAITVIIPVHKAGDEVVEMVKKAITSVVLAKQKAAEEDITWCIVCPAEVKSALVEGGIHDAAGSVPESKPAGEGMDSEYVYSARYIVNDSGDTDYCSQVNFAVKQVGTEYFSVLELDDEYLSCWFKCFYEYRVGNEDVTAFLPINIVTDTKGEHWEYRNEMALAAGFSEIIGFIDLDCLSDYTGFNLTGAVVNTQDFIDLGMYKPSIKVAFNHEFLLRATNKKMRVMVVPKEGYKHVVGREDSLLAEYDRDIPHDEVSRWFDLARREYPYTADRKKTITKKVKESVK